MQWRHNCPLVIKAGVFTVVDDLAEYYVHARIKKAGQKRLEDAFRWIPVAVGQDEAYRATPKQIARAYRSIRKDLRLLGEEASESVYDLAKHIGRVNRLRQKLGQDDEKIKRTETLLSPAFLIAVLRRCRTDNLEALRLFMNSLEKEELECMWDLLDSGILQRLFSKPIIPGERNQDHKKETIAEIIRLAEGVSLGKMPASSWNIDVLKAPLQYAGPWLKVKLFYHVYWNVAQKVQRGELPAAILDPDWIIDLIKNTRRQKKLDKYTKRFFAFYLFVLPDDYHDTDLRGAGFLKKVLKGCGLSSPRALVALSRYMGSQPDGTSMEPFISKLNEGLEAMEKMFEISVEEGRAVHPLRKQKCRAEFIEKFVADSISASRLSGEEVPRRVWAERKAAAQAASACGLLAAGQSLPPAARLAPDAIPNPEQYFAPLAARLSKSGPVLLSTPLDRSGIFEIRHSGSSGRSTVLEFCPYGTKLTVKRFSPDDPRLLPAAPRTASRACAVRLAAPCRLSGAEKALERDWALAEAILAERAELGIGQKPVKFILDPDELVGHLDAGTRERIVVRLNGMFERLREEGAGYVVFTREAHGLISHSIPADIEARGLEEIRLWELGHRTAMRGAAGPHLPYIHREQNDFIPVMSTMLLAGLVAGAERGSAAYERAVSALSDLAGTDFTVGATPVDRLQNYEEEEEYEDVAVKPIQFRGYMDIVIYMQNLSQKLAEVAA